VRGSNCAAEGESDVGAVGTAAGAISEMAARLPRDTVLVGLVGRGIGLSRSPRMHEAEGARLGLRYAYRLLDTETMGEPQPRFAELLQAAETAGFVGLNVTYPFKREALAHLDRLSDAARAAGAVNTIVLRDGERSGHNTDTWGFAESFRRGMADAPRGTVLLLGAGGAGGAVAIALLDCGVQRLLIGDTRGEAAEALAARLAERGVAGRIAIAGDLAAAVAAADGIVNATPVGMAGLPGSPIPTDLVTGRLWVAEIVYFPIETELLRAARAQGCRVLAGADMAVFQAARAFELFTGLAPDPERMKASFDAFAE